MADTDVTLSISAVAKRLNVSRSMVWKMIADGFLDAESFMRGGRLYTRVHVPVTLPHEPPNARAKSKTLRLQEQLDQLMQRVDEMTQRLIEVERDRSRLRETVVRLSFTPPPGTASMPAEQPDRFPRGIASRPNPMTHPLSELGPIAVPSRDEVLAPIRALLEAEARRGPLWRQLPRLVRN